MGTVQLSALVGASIVAASLAPAAQSGRQVEAAAYYRLIQDYRQGRADTAIAALVALPASATKSVVSASDLRWSPEEMNAAALLETEAGFGSGTLSALSARLSNADLWLDRAQRNSVDRKTDARQQDDFRRQWSLTVGRKALWLRIVGLDSMLKEACDDFPNDADLHLAYGLARETAAFSVDHLEIAAIAPFALDSALSSSSRSRSEALFQARDALERAVELNPLSAEARVRLAHVYILQKDERRAVPHLEHALSLESIPVYRFIASIMLGDLRSRAGDLERAIESYLRARHLLPNAQSAYVAHAHALRAAGRAEEAAAVVADMLGRATHEDDPWVHYPRGFEVALTELGPLRALVQEK